MSHNRRLSQLLYQLTISLDKGSGSFVVLSTARSKAKLIFLPLYIPESKKSSALLPCNKTLSTTDNGRG